MWGCAGQDDVLFDTTIRENLRVASSSADDEAMRRVLSRVGLDALLDRMPAGLGTMIGSHGNQLSSGERQRLATARLLLGNHKILIFDEPTEHLDQAAAAGVLADILALRAEHTIILISHSADVLLACDQVVHLSPSGAGEQSAAPSGALSMRDGQRVGATPAT